VGGAASIAALTLSIGWGLHSSTFQLNVSAFGEIGGVFRGYLQGDYGVSGGIRCFVLETAQVELRSGSV